MARDKILNDKMIKLFIDSIIDEDAIPDEILQAFVLRTKDIIKREYFDTVDDSFAELSDLVNNYWRNEEYKESNNTEMAFQMGRLLSCVTLLNLAINEIEKDESIAVDANHLLKYQAVLNLIWHKPGIKSGDIASVLDKKPSRMSQIMNEIFQSQNSYIIERKRGRDKHYLLTPSGEKLLQTMRVFSSDKYDDYSNWTVNIRKKESDEYYPGEEARIEPLLSQKEIEEGRIYTVFYYKASDSLEDKKNTSDSLEDKRLKA